MAAASFATVGKNWGPVAAFQCRKATAFDSEASSFLLVKLSGTAAAAAAVTPASVTASSTKDTFVAVIAVKATWLGSGSCLLLYRNLSDSAGT